MTGFNAVMNYVGRAGKRPGLMEGNAACTMPSQGIMSSSSYSFFLSLFGLAWKRERERGVVLRLFYPSCSSSL